jgi:protein ImuB
MFACLHAPAGSDVSSSLVEIARTCSPRVCARGERMVTMDVEGLSGLVGDDRAVAEQIRRAASDGGYPEARVAVAATQTAAILLACARPGITVVETGGEAAALAPLPVAALAALAGGVGRDGPNGRTAERPNGPSSPNGRTAERPNGLLVPVLSRWGIRTLGQLAALPPVELSERLGQDGVAWQRWARGEDEGPLVPTVEEETFEATFEPEWPIEDLALLEPALDWLLGPLCDRLVRRGRAAAVLHLQLRLVTRAVHARSLQLPAPMRDAGVLRTLILLALEAAPAPAGIDAVTITIEPAPGRVLQESLLERAVPPPEQVATLMARLGALMGGRRCGAPAVVDSHRPGMFAMAPFRMDGGSVGHGTWDMRRGVETESEARGTKHDGARGHAARRLALSPQPHAPCPMSHAPSVSLRRFRLPVPARVLVEHGRPIVVRTDRQNLAGGAVRACAGPWRTSGEWWKAPAAPPSELDKLRGRAGWDRDEWDVALDDGGVYRIFEDRDTGRWFMDGILD